MDVPGDIAEELLQAADQYMLEGLKRLCEVAIARTLSVDSLPAAQEVRIRILIQSLLCQNLNVRGRHREHPLRRLSPRRQEVRVYSVLLGNLANDPTSGSAAVDRL